MRNKELESFYRRKSPTFSFLIFYSLFLILLSSCSPSKQLSRSASLVIHDSSLRTAHVGISIYEPATGKYWYEYNGDKYFIPASNTKIPTSYAAMKYLGDSLPGLRYFVSGTKNPGETFLSIRPTADPTFLHRDFKRQPAYDLLKKYSGAGIAIVDTAWKEQALGYGWSWDDYNSYYMVERSALPVYGNLIRFIQVSEIKYDGRYSRSNFIYTEPNISWELNFGTDTSNKTFSVRRMPSANVFNVNEGQEDQSQQDIPFVTNGIQSAISLLKDTLPAEQIWTYRGRKKDSLVYETPDIDRYAIVYPKPWQVIYSQPTDSLLMPMMHRSDNFFAEQSLLMVSNEKLGVMSDEKIIDELLKTDLNDLPQKPRWVDGSGLSRYNLFSPKDFVVILQKMKDEFGMNRMKTIFPTGGEGTLSNYYQEEKEYIYAKTGSLSGVIALSGYLYTKKNKLLIFSILVNNHQASSTDVRRTIEKFLRDVRNEY